MNRLTDAFRERKKRRLNGHVRHKPPRNRRIYYVTGQTLLRFELEGGVATPKILIAKVI